MAIWSSTDFPYQCLLDFRRTTNFKSAIHGTVRKVDVVLDAGAGSGILSFFAAEAGASKVYAVEVDRTLAACLARSIAANNLQNVIEVLHDDIHSAALPKDVDVFICEMMETGLMDEMQVTAINSLRERNVIAPRTRMIPFQYETFVEFGYTDFAFYGYKLFVPQHNWWHYTAGNNGWLQTSFHPHTDRQRIGLIDFQNSIEPKVTTLLSATAISDGVINAVKLSADAHLVHGLVLGATNALNGDKVIPLDETRVKRGQSFRVDISYLMGGGLDSMEIRVLTD